MASMNDWLNENGNTLSGDVLTIRTLPQHKDGNKAEYLMHDIPTTITKIIIYVKKIYLKLSANNALRLIEVQHADASLSATSINAKCVIAYPDKLRIDAFRLDGSSEGAQQGIILS